MSTFQIIYDIVLPVAYASSVLVPWVKSKLAKPASGGPPGSIVLPAVVFNQLNFICTRYHSTSKPATYLKEVNANMITIGNTQFIKGA